MVIFFFWIYTLEKMPMQQHVSILWLAPLFLKCCGLTDFWWVWQKMRTKAGTQNEMWLSQC